ncbi:beta-lactamase family protein [Erysipelothrix sp. HDW6C]|uniref:serine hydrolase domain-containing protein n=1 Tax=Erysipelothrix sp. HDW6C TaxID=2714930 RepID=UPI00140E021D|nr:serine hydrolase domain-containing protein [Erysipelothrix sp. HDW6C]QIK69553.1 beta-lactamase family protein [Erysipelothrix sp. HDW6C]
MSIDKLVKKITNNKQHIELTILESDAENWKQACYGMNGVARKPSGLRYEIGSLTKIFTATLVAKLLDKGVLNLTEVQSLVDNGEYVNIPSIQRLATHTSGFTYQPLTRIQNLAMFASVLTGGKACVDNPFVGKSSKTQILDSVRTIKNYNEVHPFYYSNINYALLALLCEQAVGTPYVEQMMSLIESDLELTDTNFKFENVMLGNAGKHRQGNWCWNVEESMIASGGLYSTAADLRKFLTFHFNESHDHPFVDIMKIKHATGPKAYDMGLAWKLQDEDILWHNGGTGCFNLFIGMNQNTGKKAVVLSNYRSLNIDKLGLTLLRNDSLK